MIELADATTLCNALGRKQRFYAGERVPEYWMVDVNADIIHRMWAPVGEAYARNRDIGFGAPIVAATVVGLMIATGTL